MRSCWVLFYPRSSGGIFLLMIVVVCREDYNGLLNKRKD
jgi:hypothetical protein